MRAAILFLTLFLGVLSPKFGFCQTKPFCYFIPPAEWRSADPKMLSPHVQVGFFGKGKTAFHPSLNLATEEVDNATMKEYLKAVKEIHESDRNTSWRDLGKFQTHAGTAELTEITTKNQWGEIKMLQIILIANKVAYIVTGAMLKEEFAVFRGPIIKAFRSLTITSDLFDSVSDQDKRKALKDAYVKTTALQSKNEETLKERKDAFDDFQKLVLNDYNEMGMHWQILLLKEAFDALDLLPKIPNKESKP